MQLRPYQDEAKHSVFRCLSDAKSTLVEMATGLGKTVLFAHVAREWPGRVLVIAHRDELIRQAAEKLVAITGENVGIEMGRDRADETLFGTKVTVASIQTLSRANRRHRFHPDHFSLIIVDEGHHATASTYREVIDYFRSAKILFVTATPKRSDKIALGSVCETVAYQYGIEQAILDGWLVPVRQSVVKIDGLDFSKVRTVADDFNSADLEAILTAEAPLHAICASAYEIVGKRQALWFCTSVAHARALAGVLGRYGTGGVAFLSGDTPTEQRRQTVTAYKRGNLQHLVNCALFLEGFDAPSTSAIVMAKPTKSLSLYMQVLGRGTRPLPGVVDGLVDAAARVQAIAMSSKPEMLVIDFAGNAGRHKIIQAADVLGGKHPEEVRAYAKETMAEEEGRSADIAEALDRARDELTLMSEEDNRRKKLTARAAYETHDVDPFTRKYSGSRNGNIASKPTAQPCTESQAWKIYYLSRDTGEGNWTFAKASQLSLPQASGVIGKLLRLKASRNS